MLKIHYRVVKKQKQKQTNEITGLKLFDCVCVCFKEAHQLIEKKMQSK